jgi:hypothetical protein
LTKACNCRITTALLGGDAFCHALLSCGRDLYDYSAQIPQWIKYRLLAEGRREEQREIGSSHPGFPEDALKKLSLAGTQEQQRELEGAVHAATHMRRLVVSEKGYMGWAPLDTQPGDKICILFGGRVPFILREASERVEIDGISHNCHILLGDSYVHGLMHGEAMTMIERQEAEVQNFYLV